MHAPGSRFEDEEAISHITSRDEIGLGCIAARAHGVYRLMELSISHPDEEGHLCELSDHLFSCLRRHGIALPAFGEGSFTTSNTEPSPVTLSLSHTHTQQRTISKALAVGVASPERRPTPSPRKRKCNHLSTVDLCGL